jgi:hypothetical protein
MVLLGNANTPLLIGFCWFLRAISDNTAKFLVSIFTIGNTTLLCFKAVNNNGIVMS